MIDRKPDELNYTTIFSTYFLNKALVVLTTQLVEEWLTQEGYCKEDIAQAKNSVYLSFSFLQGSFASGSASLLSTEILKNAGCSDKLSDWMGYVVGTAVSLVMDLSPTGSLKTFISNVGGLSGKWCTKWAMNQMKEDALLILKKPTI